MSPTSSIQSVQFLKSFYLPGESVRWTVTLTSQASEKAVLVTTITSLAEVVAELRQEVSLEAGSLISTLSWQPAADAPRGYGLDLRLETISGEVIATYSAGFDVLETWTQNPRYGFMTDFEPGRTSGDAALDQLLDYHINGLQFYDWMYRHDQYLTDQEPYIDPLGRQLSRQTVENLIAAAHERNMAAMPYTAVYAASIPFYEQHPDWALFDVDGKASFFGENFLVIMDPRPGSPWTEHLLGQFDDILATLAFDGIHLDQYGAPKVGYDAHGNPYTLDQPLADLIDATKAVVTSQRGENGAVVFNAVTNWPIETVAPSAEDLVYIEVWSPYNSFNDLNALVIQGQKLGGGKPVVIAAYIDPAYEVNAQLIDAILFANGAGHIELGEQGGYLSDPYFPKYSIPSQALSEKLRRYYEFSIRYQNVIGPQTSSANRDYASEISISGVNTTISPVTDRVMPIVRSSDAYLAVSLVNLLGVDTDQWAQGSTKSPTSLTAASVEIRDIPNPVAHVYFATPDGEDFALQPLEFTLENGTLRLTLPSLEYWSMILIEWSK